MAAACPPPTSSVSVDSFESNMRDLRNFYDVISLADAVAIVTGKKRARRRCAVLTFDDSLKCTFEVALPILERLGMTATVFVSTAAIEDRRPYWWLCVDHAYRRGRPQKAIAEVPRHGPVELEPGNSKSLHALKSILRRTPAAARDAVVESIAAQLDARLNDPASQFPYAEIMHWEHAADAIRRGFSIGSHTVTHPNLTVLSPGEIERELEGSKRAIESNLGTRCLHFCYPYGAHTAEIASRVGRCGYEAAVTTIAPGKNRLGTDLYRLNRYSMPSVASKLTYVMSGFPAVLEAAGKLMPR